MKKDVDLARELEDEFVAAACRDTGEKPERVRMYVAPIIRHLQSERGGERLYIPRLGRRVDTAEIRAHYEQGRSIAATCKRFHLSRRTFYRLIEEWAERA